MEKIKKEKNRLTEKKKELLRDFVGRQCEECGLKETKRVGIVDQETLWKLHPHRINRGYMGGMYVLRNIKMLCPSCHKKMHSREFK